MKLQLKYFLFIITALAISGFIYQTYASFADDAAYQPTGRMVDVGGYQLYVEDHGEGKVTVVFDAGMGDESSVWSTLTPHLTDVARVIIVDRAGLGWSDSGQQPRTSSVIVEELHTVLSKLEVEGPVILVGHSFGGVNMQMYAMKYPGHIAGLVLVDSAHERQLETMPSPNPITKGLFKLGMWAAPLGIPRLYLSLGNPVEHAKKSKVKHQYTSLDEADGFASSLADLQTMQPDFGDMPLVVIARNQPSTQINPDNKRDRQWAMLQEDLGTRSSNGKIIFSGERQHSIHKHQPKLVAESIRTLISTL